MVAFTTPGDALFSKGFSYIAVLFLVCLLVLGMVLAIEPIATMAKREKEAELLFIGQQYRQAIASYYKSSPDGIAVLPTTLEELVLDKRFVTPRRHLRKLYIDPMTQNLEWGLVKNAQNQIMGVYSRATEMPLAVRPEFEPQGGLADGHAVSYFDWKFIYVPTQGLSDQPR